jgi:hypothetical protein
MSVELPTASSRDYCDQSRGEGRFIAILTRLNAPIVAMSTFDLCAVVTFVLLFLYAGTHWYLTIPMRAVCLCAIIIPALRSSSYLWFTCLALLAAANCYDRLLIDNHKYLLTYWVLAMCLSSVQTDSDERERVLYFNGRVLIGLCFLFAVVAKCVSADYMNGGFFRQALLLDNRFAHLAWLVGGIDRLTLTNFKYASHDLKTAYLLNADLRQLSLRSSFRFSLLVWFMSWWTIVIESSIAFVFLWPHNNHVTERGRIYLLWLFLISTYSIALVSGFAWTLAVMGLAQLGKVNAHFRIMYILVVAILLQFYQVEYVDLIHWVISRLHGG